VRLLLDTHVFVWAATDLTKLSRAAAAALAKRSNALFLSAVSVWEMAIMRSLGKLTLEIISLGQLLDLGQRKMGLQTLAAPRRMRS
jgi:PIN domain nuclease of toxin-antitoxin system